jgi:hypothetical protein
MESALSGELRRMSVNDAHGTICTTESSDLA